MSDANDTGAPNTPAGDTQNPDTVKAAGSDDTLVEGKPQGEPKAGDAKDEGKEEGAEVSYEFEFPDGVDIDEKSVEGFKALAKELKLDADTAKKIAAFETQRIQTANEANAKVIGGWAEAAKTDKEFGGDGFEQNLGVAKQALDAFGSDELRAFLKATKLGNHPEIVRAFYRAGKAMADDKFVKPGATTGASKSAADVIYGN